MCRLLAYAGGPVPLKRWIIDPPHSLLHQSQNATEAKLTTNGDGFGMAWYNEADPTPGKFRDIYPAWSDSNLPDLCRMIQSKVFLAHVRASTTGATTRENCQPFSHGVWSFAHNGQIAGYDMVRRSLENALSDRLYAQRHGTTDSELIFLLALQFGLVTSPFTAICETIRYIQSAQRQVGIHSKNTKLSLVFSDGVRLFGLRWADGRNPPTLYSQNETSDASLLASEPLDGVSANWTPLPANSFCTFTNGEMEVQPLQD